MSLVMATSRQCSLCHDRICRPAVQPSSCLRPRRIPRSDAASPSFERANRAARASGRRPRQRIPDSHAGRSHLKPGQWHGGSAGRGSQLCSAGAGMGRPAVDSVGKPGQSLALPSTRHSHVRLGLPFVMGSQGWEMIITWTAEAARGCLPETPLLLLGLFSLALGCRLRAARPNVPINCRLLGTAFWPVPISRSATAGHRTG
ncbi:hypothetical protein B0J13DRAFT_524220 [Dactylonectria estremocensis]|uniref:Uncharacterized protein n=1 Tax=Dactylonectria estremocensis TaxID=1079267 RepID=A0A9P9F0H5_9HYPO|nr:hypothetical protein B0J13DRAFT_524220 [Dactylonectria estremocensis]